MCGDDEGIKNVLRSIPTEDFCDMVLQFFPSALNAMSATVHFNRTHVCFEMRGKVNLERLASKSATKKGASPCRSANSCQAMTTPPVSPIRERNELLLSG